MILLLIILAIYLLGVILAYGRIIASFCDALEISGGHEVYQQAQIKRILLASLLSWIAFIVGVFMYKAFAEQHFFKWKLKDIQNKSK